MFLGLVNENLDLHTGHRTASGCTNCAANDEFFLASYIRWPGRDGGLGAHRIRRLGYLFGRLGIFDLSFILLLFRYGLLLYLRFRRNRSLGRLFLCGWRFSVLTPLLLRLWLIQLRCSSIIFLLLCPWGILAWRSGTGRRPEGSGGLELYPAEAFKCYLRPLVGLVGEDFLAVTRGTDGPA